VSHISLKKPALRGLFLLGDINRVSAVNRGSNCGTSQPGGTVRHFLIGFASTLIGCSFASASITYKSVTYTFSGTARAGLGDPSTFLHEGGGLGNQFIGDTVSSYAPGFPNQTEAHASGNILYEAFASGFIGDAFADILNVPSTNPAFSAVENHLRANFVLSNALPFFAEVTTAQFKLTGITPGSSDAISIDLTDGRISGILPPGEYLMECDVSLSSSEFVPGRRGVYTFDIPAPSTPVLAVAGLLLAAKRRRR